MTDRTVNVRLNLDNAGYRRNAQQSEQDIRRVTATIQQAAAQQENAVNRSAASQAQAAERAALAQTRASEQTAMAAASAARVTAESAAQSTAATRRLAATAQTVPETFQAAARVSVDAFGQVSTAAASTTRAVADIGPVGARALGAVATASTAASVALGQTSTALTAEMAAAATGTARLGLAARLAVAEAATAQQAAVAASAAASATASAGAFTRMRAAAAGWASSVRTSAASTVTAVSAAASSNEKSIKTIRNGALLLVAAFAAAAVTAARFEKAMSSVAAVANATGEQMTQLRDAALQAGRDTAYSASQAAEAEGELARAGVSVADITGGALKGALSLAAAGQLDLGEAATISAQAMNTFGLKGAQVSHIADVLAAGANKSASDVHGLGESLRMGGLLAAQTGLSLEDTVAVLSAFADHALIGSDAGTSLKTMLQRLTPQSSEAAGLMKQLGFSAYTAGGQFVGLEELADRLQKSFANLTPEARNSAMGVIFGSDSVRAATVLYQLGADGVRQYTQAVNDQGAAARMSAVQLDNLSGDLQVLKGSLEVALIESGSAANGVLRSMTQWVTDLVNAYTALPPWLQKGVDGFLGMAGIVGVASAGFLLILPRVVAFRASLLELAVTMPRVAAVIRTTTSTLLGPFGIALAAGVIALSMFGKKHREAIVDVAGLTTAIKEDSGVVGQNTRAYVVNSLQKAGALDAAKKLGVSLKDLTDAALGDAEAMKRVNDVLSGKSLGGGQKALDAIDKNFGTGKANAQAYLDAVKLVGDSMDSTTGAISNAKEALGDEATASGSATGATKDLGDAAQTTAGDLGKQETAAKKLQDALDGLNGANADAARAAIGYQSSLADLTKAVHDNGTSLDITTEKGRAVKQAVLDAADAAMKHAQAVAQQQNSVDAGNIALAQDVDHLKAVMKQAGFTADEITSLTSAYTQVPPIITTQVTDPGALRTMKDLEDIKAKVQDVPPGKSIVVEAPSADAITDLQAIGYTVQNLPNHQVKVTVPVNDAFDGSTKIQQLINGITGKNVRVTVTGEVITVGGRGQARLAEANGGVVRYGNGGIRAYAAGGENHVAQIAPAGAMRLWAEPETEGEGYIPLAQSKRARSTAILGQIATRFGYQLVPVGRFATAGGGGASYDQSRTQHVHLHGAQQSWQEQMADVLRHMDQVG
jgi:TP901 family phage tail tape measure protein